MLSKHGRFERIFVISTLTVADDLPVFVKIFLHSFDVFIGGILLMEFGNNFDDLSASTAEDLVELEIDPPPQLFVETVGIR